MIFIKNDASKVCTNARNHTGKAKGETNLVECENDPFFVDMYAACMNLIKG